LSLPLSALGSHPTLSLPLSALKTQPPDPEFGSLQSKELFNQLKDLLTHFGVQITRAPGRVDVSPGGVSKARIVELLLNGEQQEKEGDSSGNLSVISDRSEGNRCCRL
jgi:hypothetical protein